MKNTIAKQNIIIEVQNITIEKLYKRINALEIEKMRGKLYMIVQDINAFYELEKYDNKDYSKSLHSFRRTRIANVHYLYLDEDKKAIHGRLKIIHQKLLELPAEIKKVIHDEIKIDIIDYIILELNNRLIGVECELDEFDANFTISQPW